MIFSSSFVFVLVAMVLRTSPADSISFLIARNRGDSGMKKPKICNCGRRWETYIRKLGSLQKCRLRLTVLASREQTKRLKKFQNSRRRNTHLSSSRESTSLTVLSARPRMSRLRCKLFAEFRCLQEWLLYWLTLQAITRIRQIMKPYSLLRIPWRMERAAIREEKTKTAFLRPNLSAYIPAKIAPSHWPIIPAEVIREPSHCREQTVLKSETVVCHDSPYQNYSSLLKRKNLQI